MKIIILLILCLITIVYSNNELPTPAQIKERILLNQQNTERVKVEEHRLYVEGLALNRSIIFSNLKKQLNAHCAANQNKVNNTITAILTELNQSESLEVLYPVPSEIFMCVMDTFMETLFDVEYFVQSGKILVNLNKQVDQSKIVLCVSDEFYHSVMQIRCATHMASCIDFQFKYNSNTSICASNFNDVEIEYSGRVINFDEISGIGLSILSRSNCKDIFIN